METMHAAGRRTLPPVPRPSTARTAPAATPAATLTVERPATRIGDGAAEGGVAVVTLPSATSPETDRSVPPSEDDPAQRFVARLRAASSDFARAAGAESAVVREAVPPARHRRARCRVVLRHADGAEVDLTFLGPVDRPGPAGRPFEAEITRWLGSGGPRGTAWSVHDPDAPDGIAVDLTAWSATG